MVCRYCGEEIEWSINYCDYHSLAEPRAEHYLNVCSKSATEGHKP